MTVAGRLIAAVVLAVAAAAPAAAVERVRDFDSDAERHRYYALLEELRCLVCQNESLASSRADLAQDLRDEVYRLVVVEDRSNEAAIAFLVERYGDFVRYRPPVGPSTWLLWFGPGLMLVAGAGVAAWVIRRRRSAGPPVLSSAERERARRLLSGDDGPPGAG